MSLPNFLTTEYENYVIGCFIKEPDLFIDHNKLYTEHFQDSRNRMIFEKLYSMVNDEVTITPAQVYFEFANMKDHIAHVLKLAETTTANFEHNQEKVVEIWKKKSIKEIAGLTQDDDFDPNDLPIILRDLEKVDEKGIKSEQPTNEVIDELMQLPLVANEKYIGFKTGFIKFDGITGGLRRKELSYWCARPSVGKTAFSVEIFMRLLGKNVAVLYFTFEMAKSGLLIRMLSNLANIDSRNVPEAHIKFTEKDKEKWFNAGDMLKKKTYDIVETVGTTQYMRTQIRKFVREHPNQDFVIMVDYLTKIKPAKNHHGNSHLEITEISAELKEIAKDFDTHVFCLAQLSRGVEQRQDKRPMMSDIRESGSIEQDGDIIGMLYRPDYQTENDTNPSQKLEVNIIKNRNGAVGVAEFNMHKPTGRIREAV
jgi:replicative DNA helicase